MLNWSPGYKTKLQILSVKALISMIGNNWCFPNTCHIYWVPTQLTSLSVILIRKCAHSIQNILPNTSQVDACRVIWRNENNYLVPPTFYSILRVIKHLAKSKSHGTLILPHWPSASFLLFLWKRFTNTFQVFVTDYKLSSNPQNCVKLSTNKSSVIGWAKFKGDILACKLDFWNIFKIFNQQHSSRFEKVVLIICNWAATTNGRAKIIWPIVLVIV